MPNFIEQIRAGIGEKVRKAEEQQRKMLQEEAERKASELKELEAEKIRQQKAERRAQKIEATWSVVAKEVSVFLEEINLTIFGGSAKIKNWHNQEYKVSYKDVVDYYTEGGVSEAAWGHWDVQFTALCSVFKIPTAASGLVVMRPTSVSFLKSRDPQYINADLVWVDYLDPDTLRSSLSSRFQEFSNVPGIYDRTNGKTFNLDTTDQSSLIENIKNDIGEKIVALYPI